MDFLINTPAFVKVIVVFIGILIIYKSGLSLGLSIILSSIILSLWSGLGTSILKQQIITSLQLKNSLVFIVILLLLYFTETLNQTGRMEKTVTALKDLFSNKKILISGLPALVGLLPMPGGALVSAPLVESVDKEQQLPNHLKVAINYWFRHIWEYWWPLYPGVILAIRYSTLPIGIYLLIMIPFTIVAIASGYWFILRHVPNDKSKINVKKDINISNISSALWPIALLVVISVIGSSIAPIIGISSNIANLFSMFIGILFALILLFIKTPSAFIPSLKMFKSKKTWSVMMVILGVTLFSTILKLPQNADSTTYVSLMRDEFLNIGIPVVLVMMILPFISGFITGVAVGFVGASFPLCFALLGNNPEITKLMATTVFCYSFGYIGIILSPVHICFVVTVEYFKTNLTKSYPYILWPSLSILITGIILSGIFYIM